MATKSVTYTCTCGHEETSRITYTNAANRDSKIKYLSSGICRECEKEIERKEIEEEAQSLPQLEGSEKQIEWANKIRHSMIIQLKAEFEYRKSQGDTNAGVEEEKALNVIKGIASAKTFIDNRDRDIRYFVIEQIKVKEEKPLQKEIDEELTVVPENSKEATVKITTTDEYVNLEFVKNDDIKSFIKEHGFIWDHGWKISNKSIFAGGDINNKAASIGNILLANGYTVIFDDIKIKEKSVKGDCYHITQKVIFKRDGKVHINAPFEDKESRELVKAMGGKYSEGFWIVDIMKYEGLEELQEKGYYISKSVKSMIEEVKNLKEQKIKGVDIKKEKDYAKEEGIIDDLKD